MRTRARQTSTTCPPKPWRRWSTLDQGKRKNGERVRLRVPVVRAIVSGKTAVSAQFNDQKSFGATHLFAFPPVSTNCTRVNEGNAVDLNLLQMMQMTGKQHLHVCPGLCNRLTQCRRIVDYQRGGSAYCSAFHLARSIQRGQNRDGRDMTAQNGRDLCVPAQFGAHKRQLLF